MEAFRKLTAVAAPLAVANVDTDMILAARFMKTTSRKGLGHGLFHAARFDPEGRPRPEFILNRPPWNEAKILVALDNFGCGSSREHAPWALLDFGFRCIIAESFAEIFYGNCFKNGILPIMLPRAEIDRLLDVTAVPATATLTVDLEDRVVLAAQHVLPFTIDGQRRQRMLDGADDITHALGFSAQVTAHEQRVRERAPWLAETRLDQPGIWPPAAPLRAQGSAGHA